MSTSVSVNGKEIELSGDMGLNEIKAMLAQSGLDADLIDGVVASMGQLPQSSSADAAHAQTKVDCSGCSRTVVFGKGNCMYCGNPLTLPDALAEKSIDAEILEADSAESDQVSAEAAYINRLKDI